MNQNTLFNQNEIYVGEDQVSFLNDKIQNLNPSKTFILLDENTHQACLPWLITNCPILKEAEIIEIESGEDQKGLETCAQLWYALSELGADRQSLIINLGGGVITDLGGFLAATYNRGIPFIHIPTTLLAQVDASIGGKTGLNLGELKNQVGSFSQAAGIFIFPHFLKTLSEKEYTSGFGEVLKHALLHSKELWDEVCCHIDFELAEETELLTKIIHLKLAIVADDFKEKGRRKVLNLGHTIGHAIESIRINSKNPIPHGEAVVHGIIIENILSAQKNILNQEICQEVNTLLLGRYPKLYFSNEEKSKLIQLLKHDKKNIEGEWNFSLLKDFGEAVIDQKAGVEQVQNAIDIYSNL